MIYCEQDDNNTFDRPCHGGGGGRLMMMMMMKKSGGFTRTTVNECVHRDIPRGVCDRGTGSTVYTGEPETVSVCRCTYAN